MARGKPRLSTEDDVLEYIRLVGLGVEKQDAATMIGVPIASLAARIGNSPELRAKLAAAWYDGGDPLIAEAERRGKDGVLEPIIQQGKHVVGHDGLPMYWTKYSDNLLMFAIKGRRPEYKDSHKSDTTVAVQVNFEDRSAAIADVRRVLEQAGVNPHSVIDGGASQRGLPAAPDVLAEPSDV